VDRVFAQSAFRFYLSHTFVMELKKNMFTRFNNVVNSATSVLYRVMIEFRPPKNKFYFQF